MSGPVWRSPFLAEKRGTLKKIVSRLSDRFGWASILGTDAEGLAYEVTGKGYSVRESRWSERGFVVRVFIDGRCFEHAFDSLPGSDPSGSDPSGSDPSGSDAAAAADRIAAAIERMAGAARGGIPARRFSAMPMTEEPLVMERFADAADDPVTRDPGEIFAVMKEINDETSNASPAIANCRVRYEGVRLGKLYLSPAREQEQSMIWSQGYIFLILRKGDRNKFMYRNYSGLKGPSLLEEVRAGIGTAVKEGLMILDAGKLEPGEYDVIFSPDVAGIIAHEAFGHGVETDMFVRGRALASDYLGKRVGSEKGGMKDGAKSVAHVASYFFDDEGTPAGDTVIIDKGILKGGISDTLSAVILGMPRTGNGRRESFDRKAYARMTNTFFTPGTDTLDEMIASTTHGYFIDRALSGMEDPKNWGIQVVALIGREIRDGSFTGAVVSPVVLTGCVPDVLSAVTAVSGKVDCSGSGYCGKGHKEYVKVSSGGPYMKMRMRLG